MGKKILLEFSALIALAGGIWLLFYFFPLFPDKTLTGYPVEQEEKLGTVLMKNLTTSETIIHTPPLDSALQIIFDRLMTALGTTEYDYQLIVVSNGEVNAFALPGGHLVICSGLIEFCESPEELAAVLSHEIGHVENRDILVRLLKDFGMAILLSGSAGSDGTLIAEITKTAVSTSFDRKQEELADRRGMDLLIRAKINPRVVAAFFRRLSREKGTYDKSVEMLMTHPNNNSRIKASLEYPLPADFQPDSLNLSWNRVKESLSTYAPVP
ncbi:MAG: M48 family metallopeptidase [Bacteroidetes bacterium]|nr:M48 family metallopeptidase [Bacteroidota bacterium]